MKKKRITKTLLTTVLSVSLCLGNSVILSGCYRNTSVIDLISPPKLTGEQTEIFNALTNAKGSALTLKYPKTGEFLSAFVFWEDDRAMVFYELAGTTAETTILLTFLEKKDSRWECTYDIPFFATDIEKVEFEVLGDNVHENVIISYSVLNQPGKNLCVIALAENGQPEQVYLRDFCVYYEIGDFNNSGNNMLLSINGGGGDILQPVIEFAEWKDGAFSMEYSLLANPNVSEYVKSVKSVFVAKNKKGEEVGNEKAVLFLEYSRTDTIFGTEIIVWDNIEGYNGRPHNIVYERSQIVRDELTAMLEKLPNAFTAQAFARDIDGDGAVNAAGNKMFPGYNNDLIKPSERARAAIWYGITDENRLAQMYYTYLSVNNDYVFFFPPEWEEKVTVTVNHDENEVVFWEYNSDISESVLDVENELLSIVTVSKGETPNKDDKAEYKLFKHNTNPEFDYYTKVSGNSLRALALRNALKIF